MALGCLLSFIGVGSFCCYHIEVDDNNTLQSLASLGQTQMLVTAMHSFLSSIRLCDYYELIDENIRLYQGISFSPFPSAVRI